MNFFDINKISGFLISLLILVGVGLVLNFIFFSGNGEGELVWPEVEKEVQLVGEELAEKEVGGLGQIKLTRELVDWASEVEEAPQPAFRFEGEIVPARPGKKLDIAKTAAELLKAEAGGKKEAAFIYQEPQIRREGLEQEELVSLGRGKKGQIVGHFTTYLEDNQAERRNNIHLALEEIDGVQLDSEEEFSFEEKIGEPKREKGYRAAPIIENEGYVYEPGGGICQVSTTLYNAVKKADLKIDEHHYHSRAVDYAPVGQDATYYPEEKDFKFTNNLKSPLYIRGELIERYLVIYLIMEKGGTNSGK